MEVPRPAIAERVVAGETTRGRDDETLASAARTALDVPQLLRELAHRESEQLAQRAERQRVAAQQCVELLAEGKELPPPGLYDRVIRQVELPLFTAALAATRGNQIRAAELLGLNRNTLRSRIKALDIRVFRTPAP